MSEEFQYACSSGNLTQMKKYLAEGGDINFMAFGMTALHHATSSGSLKVVRFLIQNGADLNLVDKMKLTPLMLACNRGKKVGGRMASELLSAGADATYKREEDGMNALSFALWGGCSEEILQALVDAGAELPDKDFKIIRTY